MCKLLSFFTIITYKDNVNPAYDSTAVVSTVTATYTQELCDCNQDLLLRRRRYLESYDRDRLRDELKFITGSNQCKLVNYPSSYTVYYSVFVQCQHSEKTP